MKFIFGLLLLNTAFAQVDKHIIGDNSFRLLLNENKADYRHWGRAISGVIFDDELPPQGNYDMSIDRIRPVSGGYEIYQLTSLNDDVKATYKKDLCSNVSMKAYPTLFSCTAFLVEPNVVVTAGHCLEMKNEHGHMINHRALARNVQVKDLKYTLRFVFSNGRIYQNGNIISDSEIYNLKRVITTQNDDDRDFAVIELDRNVEGVEPLHMNHDATNLHVGDQLALISHPLGLPMVVSDGAQINGFDKMYFTSDLDLYGGASGGPVFDLRTGDVVGILSAQILRKDFHIRNGCMTWGKYQDNDATKNDSIVFSTTEIIY